MTNFFAWVFQIPQRNTRTGTKDQAEAPCNHAQLSAELQKKIVVLICSATQTIFLNNLHPKA